MFDLLKKPGFKNWIKCSVGLIETKEALEFSIRSRFETFYDSGNFFGHHLEQQTTASPGRANWISWQHITGECSEFNVTRNKGTRRWEIKSECRRCKAILESLLEICEDPFSQNIYWSNSKLSQLPTELQEWEITKVFMPKGHKMNNGPKDTDAVAIFNIINTCTLFGAKDHRVLDQLTEARNKVMHSGDNEITTQEMEDILDLMIKLLNFDNGNDINGKYHIPFKDRPECRLTAEQLENLKDAEVEITLDMMRESLINKEKAIKHDIQKGKEEGKDTSVLETICKETVEMAADIVTVSVPEVYREKNELEKKHKLLESKIKIFEKFVNTEKERGALLKEEVLSTEKLRKQILNDTSSELLRVMEDLAEPEKRERNELQTTAEERELLVNYVNQGKESLVLLKQDVSSLARDAKRELVYIHRCVEELAEMEERQRKELQRMSEEKELLSNNVNQEKESLVLMKDDVTSMKAMLKSDMTNVLREFADLGRRATELEDTECFCLVLVLLISVLAAILMY